MLTNKEIADYKLLADAMLIASGAVKGREATDIEISAEDIFRKFFRHYTTIFTILNNPCVFSADNSTCKVFDFASINVVCRAAIESYLLYHWIFNNLNDTTEAVEYRHIVWRITSLYWRSKLRTKYTDTTKLVETNTESISILANKLKQNKEYLRLTNDAKTKCLKKIKEGREPFGRPSWKMLMEFSGIDPHFCQMYGYLCEYSHSGAVSTVQIREAQNEDEQARLCHASLTLTMVVAAKFVRSYCNIFDDAKNVLDSRAELLSTVDYYANIGEAKLDEHF